MLNPAVFGRDFKMFPNAILMNVDIYIYFPSQTAIGNVFFGGTKKLQKLAGSIDYSGEENSPWISQLCMHKVWCKPKLTQQIRTAPFWRMPFNGSMRIGPEEKILKEVF